MVNFYIKEFYNYDSDINTYLRIGSVKNKI